MTMKCIEAVAEFHRHIGVIADPSSSAQAALRARLILEEYAETYAALQDGNLIDAADGLADLRYVVLGTAVVYGVEIPDDDTNTSDKPLRVPMAEDALAFDATWIATIIDILSSSVTPDIALLRNALTALNTVIGQIAQSLGIPLHKVFQEVHRSNMTKAARSAGTGSKYGGVNAKGPGYSQPDIAGVLGMAQ